MNKKALFLVPVLMIVWFSCAYSQVLDSPRDGIFDKIHSPEKKPVPYAAVREADVVWQKRIWRIIDLRQKINQPFYYPETPQKGWRNFMTVVMDAVKAGDLRAYDAANDEFTTPLTFQEIENKFTKSDTIDIFDPNNPQRVLRKEVVKEPLKISEIYRLKIKEIWFFDKQRSQLDVRILGICPVMDLKDSRGNFVGYQNLFWIYFPEARPVFAKAEVFNRHNSSERRTYDDMFWKRIFGSYIYKEENVYDRIIGDYATGMDALLESDRIKNEIFKFEHELWEF